MVPMAREGPLDKTETGWEIYPVGLHRFLTATARGFTGELPLYVTENGMAAPDTALRAGWIEDTARIAYLARHLEACRATIAEGVPLKGYFCWSLLHNYEWKLGYDARFGLVHVDYDSLRRTPKASYHTLAAALERP